MFETHSCPPPLCLLDAKANVLVDNNGRARIAGFNPLSVASDQSAVTSPAMGSGTIRWMSPELFAMDGSGFKENHTTKESDCYALGMVIYEVLSGQIPYAPCPEPIVILRVLNGDRPERPQGAQGAWFTDRIWEILQLCWSHRPSDRISAKTVLLGLESDSSPLKPSSDMAGDVERDSGGQLDAAANESGTFSPFHPKLILTILALQ